MSNMIPENEKALLILKNEGEMTLKEMAKELAVTTEGARFQLLKLANGGFVKSESRSEGRGRPKQIWSLTEQGHAKFPDTHSGLTVKLIEKIRENLGEEALDEIIASTGKDNAEKYQKQIAAHDDLEEKIKKLAAVRSKEGYMANYEKQDDGSYLLVENHCPICAAAKICQGFCKAELQTFKTVLGEDLKIKRIHHILAGARRCAYKIEA